MKYSLIFDSNKITNCMDCPICYDTLYCSVDEEQRLQLCDDVGRPDGCGLIEIKEK